MILEDVLQFKDSFPHFVVWHKKISGRKIKWTNFQEECEHLYFVWSKSIETKALYIVL